MASRTLAGGLALKGDWLLGENNWKDEMDLNLLKLSVLVQGSVLSLVSATPGAPVEGDRHIFKADHPTQANKVAVYDEATWKYLDPWPGLSLLNIANNIRYEYYTVGGWKKLVIRPEIIDDAAAILTLTDAHMNAYVRRSNAGANTITTPASTDLANWVAGDEVRLSSIGAGKLTIVAGAGVTIQAPAVLSLRAAFSQAVLTFEGGVIFSLTGDLG